MSTLQISHVTRLVHEVYGVELTDAQVTDALASSASGNAQALAKNGKLDCKNPKSLALCVNAVYDAHRVAGKAKLPRSDAKWATLLAGVEHTNRSEGGKKAAEKKADKPKSNRGRNATTAPVPVVHAGTPSDVAEILKQAKALGATVTVQPNGAMSITFA